MNIKKITLKLVALILMGVVLGGGGAYLWSAFHSQQEVTEIPLPIQTIPIIPALEVQYPYVLAPNSTLNSALRELKVTPQIIHQIVEAAKPVMDLGRLNAGVRFQVTHSEGSDTDITGIRFRFSPAEMLSVHLVTGVWTAEKITEVVDTKVVTFNGVVNSSLWGSAVQAKMDPNLISELADVFAWQIDFAREVQANDRWRISVEQKSVKGQPIGWGSILAAEYETSEQKFSAVLFHVNTEQQGYFAPDGSNLRRMFLKSPLRYSRISSRFTTKRFHPILMTNRAHLGVDYAAPIGTPIRAVGDGEVVVAGWNGGAGKMIRLRHNSIYTTAYKHLSGFGKGVRSGSRVSQGQIIGYVGTTGLSTGPHLHFEFYQGGKFVDPLGHKFPSAEPVPSTLMTQFQTRAKTLMASLPPWDGSTATRKTANVAGESATTN